MDWAVDASNESSVAFESTDGSAVVSVDVYSYQAELESWVAQIVQFAEDDNVLLFDLISQTTNQNLNGTGSAFMIYRAQSSPWFCVEHVKILLVVTSSRSYSLISVLCENALVEYADIERAIVFDYFEIKWENQ